MIARLQRVADPGLAPDRNARGDQRIDVAIEGSVPAEVEMTP